MNSEILLLYLMTYLKQNEGCERGWLSVHRWYNRMIHVRPLEAITSFLAIHTPRLMFAILLLEKDTFKLKLLLLPVTADLAVFSVWNIKNVCFLVCIFSTNLQRLSLLKNHGSDLKIIIFKTGEKRKDHIGFHLP